MRTEEQTEKCRPNNFRRARYFHGMLLGDRDFTEEQHYHLQKRWLLNRTLHGSGVACGLELERIEGSNRKIEVGRGVALDRHGREIVVCEPLELDLTKVPGWPQSTVTKPPATAAECVKQMSAEPATYYLGIAYCDRGVAPVPVYSAGDECEHKVCEYSRIQEGFRFKILDKCPRIPHPKEGFLTGDDRGADCAAPLPCPDCPAEDEDYVGLGTIELEDGEISIDMKECRCYVLTGDHLRFLLALIVGRTEWGSELDFEQFLCNPSVSVCGFGGRTVGTTAPDRTIKVYATRANRAEKRVTDLSARVETLARALAQSKTLSQVQKAGREAGGEPPEATG